MLILFDTRQRHFLQNPYIWQLQQTVPEPCTIIGFTWTRALFGRYEIFHAHWPEYLVSRRGPVLIRMAYWLLFTLFLVRLQFSSVRVVVTAHNPKPHDSMLAIERLLLRSFYRVVHHHIFLSRIDSEEATTCSTKSIIHHPDYSLWMSQVGPELHHAPPIGGPLRIVIPGNIRRYKSISEGIRAFCEAAPSNANLIVAGSCGDADYLKELSALADLDSRVSLHARRLNDEELLGLLASAHLIWLPYLRIGNSGVALLALTARRPVVAMRQRSTLELQRDYGSAVHLIDSLLEIGTVASEAIPCFPTSAPLHRSPADCAAKHAAIYEHLARRKRKAPIRY